MSDQHTHTDSLDVSSVSTLLDKQPEKVYQAEKAAAHGKYILSLAKNLYERAYNRHYVNEKAGKTVNEKQAYALEQVAVERSSDMDAYLTLMNQSTGDELVAGGISVEESLRMIELKSSELFAKYHLEQNTLDVLRQKASLLKELINSKV